MMNPSTHSFYVYRWTNKINGHMYIGKGKRSRAWSHIKEARKSTPGSRIACAIKKYGAEAFELMFLEEGLTNDESLQRERWYIAKWNTCHDPQHYNLTEGGDGGSLSDETKNLISESSKHRSYESRLHSEETKRKIGLAGKGRKHSDETRQRMSDLAKCRPACSEEVRKKLSDKAKRRVVSLETRRKFSEARRGQENANSHASRARRTFATFFTDPRCHEVMKIFLSRATAL